MKKRTLAALACSLIATALTAQVGVSFSSQDTLEILGHGPAGKYPSAVTASGMPPYLTGLSITLHQLRAYGDNAGLDLLLESPSGKWVLFQSDLPHKVVNGEYFNLSFDLVSQQFPTTIGTDWPWHAVNIDTTSDHFPAPGPGKVVQPHPTLADFLNEDPNGEWKLWAHDDEADGSYARILGWDLYITADAAPTCPFVEGPWATKPTETTLLASWRGNGPSEKWDVFVGFQGEFPGAGAVPNFAEWPNDTILLENLVPGEFYSIYARTACDDGSRSEWREVQAATIGTGCQSALPLALDHPVRCDTLPAAATFYLKADGYPVWQPNWLFRFVPERTAEYFSPALFPWGWVLTAPDTLPNCPADGWRSALSDGSGSAGPVSLGVLQKGVPYFLGISGPQPDPLVEVSDCPGCADCGGAGPGFTDSLIFYFSVPGFVEDSDSVEVYFGKKPLAPPTDLTPANHGTVPSTFDPNGSLGSPGRYALIGGLESNTEYECYGRKRSGPATTTGWWKPVTGKTQHLCARAKDVSIDTVTHSWADLHFTNEKADSIANYWNALFYLPGSKPPDFPAVGSDDLFSWTTDTIRTRVQNIDFTKPLHLFIKAGCDLDPHLQPWQGPFDVPAGQALPMRVQETYCGEDQRTLRDYDHHNYTLDGIHYGNFDPIRPKGGCGPDYLGEATKLFRYRANHTGNAALTKLIPTAGHVDEVASFFVLPGSSLPTASGWQHIGCWKVVAPFHPPIVFPVEKDSSYYLLSVHYPPFGGPTPGSFSFWVDSCAVKCPGISTLFKIKSTPTTIQLGWNKALPTGGKYVVEHRQSLLLDHEYFETTDTTIELTGLNPVWHHEFWVRTFCPDGEAGPTYPLSVAHNDHYAFRSTEATRCNPAFVPPGSPVPVGYEAVEMTATTAGEHVIYGNLEQLYVYDGSFDPADPAKNLLAARTGPTGSGWKDTVLQLAAGQKLALVAASERIRKKVGHPGLPVDFYAAGPAEPLFGEAVWGGREAGPHGHVPSFEAHGTLFHNLTCPDTSGWMNLYATGDLSDIHSDRLLLSIKGFQTPYFFQNGDLRLRVEGQPGASLITSPPAWFVLNESGWWEMNRYWNISFQNLQVPWGEFQPTGPLPVRFYYTEKEFADLKTAIEGAGGKLDSHDELIFSKINGTHLAANIAPWLGHPYMIAADSFDASYGFWPYANGPEPTSDHWLHGTFAGEHYAEFEIRWFSGGGGGSTTDGNLPTTRTEGPVRPGGVAARLFPNPSGGGLTVEWPGLSPKNASVEFFTSLGRLARSLPIDDGAERLETTVGDLPEGVYFVKIISEGRAAAVLKFVRQ